MPPDDESLVEEPPPTEAPPLEEPPVALPAVSIWAQTWITLKAFGWREAIFRYASHLILLVVLLTAIAARRWEVDKQVADLLPARLDPNQAASATLITPTPSSAAFAPTNLTPITNSTEALQRLVEWRTLIPYRGRSEVITYTVQKGDTLFGIATRYGLKPETVLWSNDFTLNDDPHDLLPGQTLNILPVDGIYHFVVVGNTVERVAQAYGVTAPAITDWGPNRIDVLTPTLTAGTWLVIPGGRRELKAWTVPTLTRRDRMTNGNNYGQCGGPFTGAVGSGAFGWPTDQHTLAGNDYSEFHRGLDFYAPEGAAVYAVDGGVVVYAGVNDRGYGNLVVIDHGTGWQSVYGHLGQIRVECGVSVTLGQVIGLGGGKGHAHFEVRYEGVFVNPWTVLH